MKWVLCPSATKVLFGCLNCLAKMGKQLVMNTKPDIGVYLSTTDDAATTHLIFGFGTGFSESWDIAEDYHALVPLHLFIRVFRMDNYSDLERTEITGTSEYLQIQFFFDLNFIKDFKIRISHGSTKLPTRLAWRHRHYFIARFEEFRSVLERYGPQEETLPDLTLVPAQSQNEDEGLSVSREMTMKKITNWRNQISLVLFRSSCMILRQTACPNLGKLLTTNPETIERLRMPHLYTKKPNSRSHSLKC